MEEQLIEMAQVIQEGTVIIEALLESLSDFSNISSEILKDMTPEEIRDLYRKVTLGEL